MSKKPISTKMRENRRKAAEERDKAYHEKYPTTQAKLDALPPTGCTRQRTRLTAQLAAEQSKKEAHAVADQVKSEKKGTNQ